MQLTEKKKRLLFMAFAAVDFFAAVEVTSFIVAAPRVAAYFGLGESQVSSILNSYIYAVFGSLLVFYLLGEKIRVKTNVKRFFMAGLLLFLSGSVLGLISGSEETFYLARLIQGVGAAMSFIGQLWIMTYSFKSEIERPLFWTETGSALGVLAGPFLGGVLADWGNEGWRMLFLLNALVAMLASAAVAKYFQDKKDREIAISGEGLRIDFYYTMLILAAIAATTVASEFIASVFLQKFKNYSGTMTGLVILSGSAGLIIGSASAISFKTKKQRQIIRGLWGMLGAVLAMGTVLSLELLFLAPATFFAVGFFYGFLGVILYAYISHMLPQRLLIKGITIYLIVLQLGGVAGIYVEKIWRLLGYNFSYFTIAVCLLVWTALLLSFELADIENIEGDVYEIVPLKKTVFRFFGKIFAEIANIFQELFYILIIMPFGFIFKVKSYGLEDIKVENQMIVISNHGARLDAWVILAALGFKNFIKLHPFRIPIAKSVYETPIVNWLFRITGMYKIESRGELDKSLEDTFRHLDGGHSMIFFPQGKMVKHGEEAVPKKGIAHIIKRNKLHILPVKIVYSGCNKFRRGNMFGVSVIFGDSVHSEWFKSEHRDIHLHQAAMDCVYALEEKASSLMEANRESRFSTEIVTDGPRRLRDLLNIVIRSFPEYWEEEKSRSHYKKILSDPQNIVIFLKNCNEVVGCLVAMPHNAALKNIKSIDPAMTRRRNVLYVEAIAILPEFRKRSGQFKLLVALMREAKKRGINKFSMHLRTDGGYSAQITKLFSREVVTIRRMRWKWEKGEEDMDYVEGVYDKPIVYLQIYFLVNKFLASTQNLSRLVVRFMNIR